MEFQVFFYLFFENCPHEKKKALANKQNGFSHAVVNNLWKKKNEAVAKMDPFTKAAMGMNNKKLLENVNRGQF